jgi:hypothetical protein
MPRGHPRLGGFGDQRLYIAAAESPLGLTASSWDAEMIEGQLLHRRDEFGQPTNGIDSLGPAERDCRLNSHPIISGSVVFGIAGRGGRVH